MSEKWYSELCERPVGFSKVVSVLVKNVLDSTFPENIKDWRKFQVSCSNWSFAQQCFDPRTGEPSFFLNKDGIREAVIGSLEMLQSRYEEYIRDAISAIYREMADRGYFPVEISIPKEISMPPRNRIEEWDLEEIEFYRGKFRAFSSVNQNYFMEKEFPCLDDKFFEGLVLLEEKGFLR